MSLKEARREAHKEVRKIPRGTRTPPVNEYGLLGMECRYGVDQLASEIAAWRKDA
jgi:hypothetical protein